MNTTKVPCKKCKRLSRNAFLSAKRFVKRGELVEARPGYLMPLNLPARVLRIVTLPHDDKPGQWIELEGEGGYWPRFKFQRSAQR